MHILTLLSFLLFTSRKFKIDIRGILLILQPYSLQERFLIHITNMIQFRCFVDLSTNVFIVTDTLRPKKG